jgi:hypothetical protein
MPAAIKCLESRWVNRQKNWNYGIPVHEYPPPRRDKPYEFNDEHKKEYPAEKYKKKK